MKQVNDGIVEVIKEDEKLPEVGAVTYLPHRAVVKEEKARKIRVVYDASAKAGVCSLNECLYKGASLTPLIFDSWLRFRLHSVAIVADIESASYKYLWHQSIEIFYGSCGLRIFMM